MYSSVYEYRNWSSTQTAEHNLFNQSVTLKGTQSLGKQIQVRLNRPDSSEKPHGVLLYSGYWDRGAGVAALTIVNPAIGEIGLYLGRYKDQEWFKYPFPKLMYGTTDFQQHSSQLNCPAQWNYSITRKAVYQDETKSP
jgi:hypothetical protein